MVAYRGLGLVLCAALIAGCGGGGGAKPKGDGSADVPGSDTPGSDTPGSETSSDTPGSETVGADGGVDQGKEGPPPGVDVTPTDDEGKVILPTGPTMPKSMRVFDRATNRAVSGAVVESAKQ